ncbi:hypothetical protein [Sodalis ligni]|uniref:hypothetical protein n=1 Tax=Sodalis TaxID=84565 RepID=UPI0014054DD4|nr:hypothetical protein [Sodalis ligni]
MSAKDAKIRHQQVYQERVEAVRSGKAQGRVMEKRPEGIVAARNPRQAAFF